MFRIKINYILLILCLALVSCSDDSCEKITWYQDNDADGLGNPDVSVEQCEAPNGYVSNDNDDNDNQTTSTECPPATIQIGPTSIELIPQSIDERGSCDITLAFAPEVNIGESDEDIIIVTNSIPDHQVGLFGMVAGALNPNAVSEVNVSYSIDKNPTVSETITPLLNPNSGPEYAFGVLLNGVLLDPEAAEPFPHEGIMSPNVNWEWNLDAMIINLGLDCNNAHVQPTGKYHYHGPPTLFLESVNQNEPTFTLIGYAADGFPIYYKYGYSEPSNTISPIVELMSSYSLKEGERPGNGSSAPCGEYNGVYTNDWQYVEGAGDLDECNGRFGLTPEYPNGTYYYVVTDLFPFVPRCLKGTPSNDFRIRG